MQRTLSILLVIAMIITGSNPTVYAQEAGTVTAEIRQVDVTAPKQTVRSAMTEQPETDEDDIEKEDTSTEDVETNEEPTDKADLPESTIPEQPDEPDVTEQPTQEEQSEAGKEDVEKEEDVSKEEPAVDGEEEPEEEVTEQEAPPEDTQLEESADTTQEQSPKTDGEIESEEPETESETETEEPDTGDGVQDEEFMEGEIPVYDNISTLSSSPTVNMLMGESHRFAYNGVDLNGGFSVTSYSWSASNPCVSISGQTYSSCQVTALTPGTATLYFRATTSRTYYMYVDVQRTQKKYFTQIQNYSWQWNIVVGKRLTVTFDANDGSVTSNPAEVGYGGGMTYGDTIVTFPVPTRNGYVFDGWFTDKEGGTQVKNDTVVSIDHDHTLYAHWVKAHEYTVHFDGNGSDGGTMADQRYAYGQSYTLPANAFVKDGNRFVKWTTTKDGIGGNQYTNRDIVRNLSKEDEVITLYAQWSSAKIAKGKVDGTELSWVIDADGTLIFSGTGPIPYMDQSYGKWWRAKEYKDQVKAIIVEEGVTNIGDYAFYGMSNVESIQIWAKISQIGRLGMNLSALKEVRLPDSLTSIGDDAFWNCTSLKDIRLPDSVARIGEYAFWNCTSLTEINLPDSLTIIGMSAFQSCGLERIELPDSLTSIGERAFQNCNKVTELQIPASVQSIESGNAFGGMSSLVNITVDEKNTKYAEVDGVLFNSAKTKLLCYPGAHGSEYVVPDGVTTIDEVFSDTTNIEKVIMPDSVQSLDSRCFGFNTTIKEIYFRGTPPTLGRNTVGGCNTFASVTATIYYPTAYEAQWISAQNEYNKANSVGIDPVLTWKPFSPHDTITDCSVTVGLEDEYEYDGTEKRPSVRVEDAGMILEEGVDYTLTYLDNTNAGTATIRIQGKGKYKGARQETFVIYRAQQYMSVNISSQNMLSKTTMDIEGVYGIGDISYESSTPDIASVSEDGVITARSIGSAVITVRASGDNNYEEDEEILEITVGHNPILPALEISADKETLTCHANTEISLSDLVVSAVYEDGYREKVTNFSTNVSDIDTSTTGEKKLTISYKSGDIALSTTLTLTVQPHIAGEPVHENLNDRFYDEVIYCSVCHKELSRETKEGTPENEDTPGNNDTPGGEDTPGPEDGKEGLWFIPFDDPTYTGSAVKPAVQVYYGNTPLIEKTDYTVTYKNNTKASDAAAQTGAPAITVMGKGSYGGKATVTFSILPKNLGDPDMEYSFVDAYTYKTGTQPKLSLTVKYGKQTLKKDRDFTLTYKDKSGTKIDTAAAEGSYTLVIAGKGNYTGEKELPFEITNKTPVSRLKISKIASCVYDGTPKKPSVTVKDGKKELEQGTDYELSYENNTEVGKATVIVKGKGDYAGSRKAAFSITGTPLSKATITGFNASVEYTGESISQDVQLTVRAKNGSETVEKTLRKGTDYEVRFLNCTSAGKASMILTGKCGYTGTVKKTFTIKAYDIKADNSSKIGISTAPIKAVYAKGGAKPDVEIKFNGRKLVLGKDYTLTYSNNKAVTTAGTSKMPSITVKGKGNFKGTLSAVKTFTIEKQSLSIVKATSDDVVYQNKAGNYKSVPVLYDLDGKKLSAGTDYSKTYQYSYIRQTRLADGTIRKAGETANENDIVPAGTAMSVTISAPETSKSGNYQGQTAANYHVTAKGLKKANVKVLTNFEYTGREIRLTKKDLQVTPKGESQPIGSYEILEDTYKNNVKKGTASVQIRGTGEYGGIITVKYKIGAHLFNFFTY